MGAPQAEELLQRIDNMSWRPRWLMRGALLSATAATFYSWCVYFHTVVRNLVKHHIAIHRQPASGRFRMPAGACNALEAWGVHDQLGSEIRGRRISAHTSSASLLQVFDSVHTWQAGLQCGAPVHVLDPHPLLDRGTCMEDPVVWARAGSELVEAVAGG